MKARRVKPLLGGKKLMRGLRLTASAIALAAFIAPAAQAQDTAEVRRLTILSFSEPVQLPGKTLAAGKYRFEMADVNNAAHTVRVLSEDGKTVIGTFHTIPSTQPQRDLRDQDTLVMFSERPAGQPQAAREWYYPGRSIGEEFVYPRAQALQLAKANNTSVATEEEGKISRVESNEQAAAPAAAASSAPAAPAAPSGQNAANQQSAAPSPAPARPNASVGTSGQAPTTTPAPAPARPRTLPRTASQLYLIALISALSFFAALGIRQVRLGATRR